MHSTPFWWKASIFSSNVMFEQSIDIEVLEEFDSDPEPDEAPLKPFVNGLLLPLEDMLSALLYFPPILPEVRSSSTSLRILEYVLLVGASNAAVCIVLSGISEKEKRKKKRCGKKRRERKTKEVVLLRKGRGGGGGGGGGMIPSE